jgi:hypothetical protein
MDPVAARAWGTPDVAQQRKIGDPEQDDQRKDDLNARRTLLNDSSVGHEAGDFIK